MSRCASRFRMFTGMIVFASLIAARGGSCYPCPPTHTTVVPLLPPSSDGGPGGPIDTSAACELACPGALDCKIDAVITDGGSVPVAVCTVANGCEG
jgi:hypothetical protein